MADKEAGKIPQSSIPLNSQLNLQLNSQLKAFNLRVDSDWVGVYPSEEGPKLFYNREIYPLTNNFWDVEMLIGKEYNLFIFYWMGEMKISFKYDRNSNFFTWLYDLLNFKGNRRNFLPLEAM